ncbi:extracellular catalytic domain type 1 short-chain-length polyhydroxyalkanoate depolymerase [Pseudoroseicyclus sp. H15]
MNDVFKVSMQRSLDLTLAGNPAKATRVIQAALNGAGASAPAGAAARPLATARGTKRPRGRARAAEPVEDAVIVEDAPPAKAVPRADPRGQDGLEKHGHHSAHGARDYWLHVPADHSAIRGVIMMLHGCTQTALDFARGTQMVAAAEAAGFATIWPEQTRSHNSSSCWNWFRVSDQAAAGGEPALLADLARSVAEGLSVPDGNVFVSGLSAGGAMAAILADTHPRLFGAVGIHSGLAPCSARDVMSALSAMRGTPAPGARAVTVPCIVFQGLADTTVAPGNTHQITGPLTGSTTRTTASGGRSTRVTSGTNSAGRPVELWEVAGAGHAWAGGSQTGSFTDPSGPDASAEMVRFFSAQC